MHNIYPVAEYFYSIQGEGFWTGTPMFFVRLAHCPVGKVPGICRSWDGRSFVCDTGESYHKPADNTVEWNPYTKVKHHMSAEEIWGLARQAGSKTLLLTGGEPLIYDLKPFVDARHGDETIHVETSGTIDFNYALPIWYTVSPKHEYKQSCIELASELKILIDANVKEQDLIFRFVRLAKRIYVQPIEEPDDPGQTKWNIRKAVDLCLQHPSELRLSLQTHKWLGIR